MPPKFSFITRIYLGYREDPSPNAIGQRNKRHQSHRSSRDLPRVNARRTKICQRETSRLIAPEGSCLRPQALILGLRSPWSTTHLRYFCKNQRIQRVRPRAHVSRGRGRETKRDLRHLLRRNGRFARTHMSHETEQNKTVSSVFGVSYALRNFLYLLLQRSVVWFYERNLSTEVIRDLSKQNVSKFAREEYCCRLASSAFTLNAVDALLVFCYFDFVGRMPAELNVNTVDATICHNILLESAGKLLTYCKHFVYWIDFAKYLLSVCWQNANRNITKFANIWQEIGYRNYQKLSSRYCHDDLNRIYYLYGYKMTNSVWFLLIFLLFFCHHIPLEILLSMKQKEIYEPFNIDY